MDKKMKKNDRNDVRKSGRERPIFKAQGLVEFALILPIILITLFVLVELARVLHAWMAIENGARAGIRYAVTAEFNPDFCPPTGCVTEQEESIARVASIHDAAWAGSSSIVRVGFGEADEDEVSYFNVIVCDPENLVAPASTFGSYSCESDVVPSGEDPGQPGQPVVVIVEFNHPLLTPLLTSVWPQLRLNAKRQAKVETYRIPLPIGTAPAYNSPTPKPTNTPNPTNTPPGPAEPPRCDALYYWLVGSPSQNKVTLKFVGYPTDERPPGAIYRMTITQVYLSQSTEDPLPVLNSYTWETWNEAGDSSTRTDAIGERDGYIIFNPSPSYDVGHCYPNGCPTSGYHYQGELTAQFGGPLTRMTNMKIVIEFPDYPEVKCSGWRHYDAPGYPVDSPEPYISDTPNPNPPTDTPTTVWAPPTPTYTESLGGPTD
jgi:hypothetical protein